MVFNDSLFMERLNCSTFSNDLASSCYVAPYFSPISHPPLSRQRKSPPVTFVSGRKSRVSRIDEVVQCTAKRELWIERQKWLLKFQPRVQLLSITGFSRLEPSIGEYPPSSRRRALFTTDYHELILGGSSIISAAKLFQQGGTNNKEWKNQAICWNQIFSGIRRLETIRKKKI